MIDRFDVSCNLDNLKSGRYVLYEDHLAELAEAKKDLALNASMLARQTDLARAAETAEKHLRNALENIRYNTRDNNAFMIAEDALKEQP
jgi:hypothetical protein